MNGSQSSHMEMEDDVIIQELRRKQSEYEGGALRRGCMDFEKYGQDCMGNDCVTKTEFACCGALLCPSQCGSRDRG